jgi:thiamine biosynthesis lipoprotein
MTTAFKVFLALTVMIGVLLGAGCAGDPRPVVLEGHTMGTTWTVRIAGISAAEGARLAPLLAARLNELNRHLSHYEPESELSTFNKLQNDAWFSMSTDLATVVVEALKVSEESNGAFDITVAPAVDAWGFGPGAATGQRPDIATLEFAQLHSGYKKLQLRDDFRALRKLDPLLRLDLSAIAKGYAVDQLTYLLESRDIRNYMVEIGGEVRTAGTRPDGKGWRIGIESVNASLPIQYVIAPGDEAVATSGNYRNFYLLDGRKIAHTIDPATAMPADNGLESVSVIAPDTMQADAYATTIMVLGPDAGFAFAERLHLPALLIPSDTKQPARRTTEFERYLIR